MTVSKEQNASQVNINVEFPEGLRDFEKRFNLKIPSMMRRVANEGKSFWKTLAGQKLKSSRMAYVKGIDIEKTDNNTMQLSLSGYVAYHVEVGRDAFDMKPGFLKNGRYKVVPLNVNRYINMQKPTVFRTVSVNSPAASWQHPGWKGMKLADEVVRELQDTIVPRNIEKMFKEMQT